MGRGRCLLGLLERAWLAGNFRPVGADWEVRWAGVFGGRRWLGGAMMGGGIRAGGCLENSAGWP